MNTGERIRREREAKGMSAAELARKAGVHQTTIDKIEKRGSSRPRSLPEIAKVLGVNEKWLRTAKGPKYPEKGPEESVFPWEIWAALTDDHKQTIINFMQSFSEVKAILGDTQKYMGTGDFVTSRENLVGPKFLGGKPDKSRAIRK